MSKRQINTYSSEFKESAIKLALESDQSIAATARELDINNNTLHTWISKYSRPVEGKKSRTDDQVAMHSCSQIDVMLSLPIRWRLTIRIFSWLAHFSLFRHGNTPRCVCNLHKVRVHFMLNHYSRYHI